MKKMMTIGPIVANAKRPSANHMRSATVVEGTLPKTILRFAKVGQRLLSTFNHCAARPLVRPDPLP